VNGSELSPADMQNMHAAFGGVAKAQASTGEQARETVTESSTDTGQHRTNGQTATKNTDSQVHR
jgi:hypothetical protein